MDLKRLLPKLNPLTRANRVAPAITDPWEQGLAAAFNPSWTPLTYAEYYARSALVYSAIKLRQDAIAAVPLRVYAPHPRHDRSRAAHQPVPDSHPAQKLLDYPNPFWTRGDLWRATETYLGLWGVAYWGIERDDLGRPIELWPLRSDRVRVVPHPDHYLEGFVYVGKGRQLVPYAPDDIVWIRYFNPLDEHAGLSPIAPLRLSADMGLDALRAGRASIANDSAPALVVETVDTPTDEEVREFYKRWETRFKGPKNARRPVLLGGGMKASGLGFSPKDMEYVQTLRWSLEDVSRVYGIPKPMLGDVERITYSNYRTARRVFWEDTILPHLAFYQEAVNRMLRSNFPADGLSAKFDLTGITALRDSENDRAKRRKTYVDAGIMTPNEIREEMNLPPINHPPGSV